MGQNPPETGTGIGEVPKDLIGEIAGLGKEAGSDPLIQEKAAEENAEEITELIPDDDFHYDFAAGSVYGVSGDYLRLDFTNNTSMSFKLTNATQYCIYRKGRKQFELADKNSIMVGKKALVQVLNGYASNVFVFE